jgi:hypothetical protein
VAVVAASATPAAIMATAATMLTVLRAGQPTAARRGWPECRGIYPVVSIKPDP